MKWKMHKFLYLPLLFAFGFIISCEKETIKPIKVLTATFSKDIQPIFDSKCTECHNGSRNPNLISGYSYKSLTKGGYYDTITPSQSKLYIQLTTNSSHIPKTSDDQKQKILLWITKGAKND
jgi:hypothetical protein